jgi:ribosome-associated protein
MRFEAPAPPHPRTDSGGRVGLASRISHLASHHASRSRRGTCTLCEMVVINSNLEIPESEISFRYSRSSGPGGQNVNKVATKVTLLFEVRSSKALTDDQKARIEERLTNRISSAGVLHVTSQRHRTRSANQRDVVERFADLIGGALHERRRRKRTRLPSSAKKRRLETKRRRSHVKTLRRKPSAED